jgi:hypothetical protein
MALWSLAEDIWNGVYELITLEDLSNLDVATCKKEKYRKRNHNLYRGPRIYLEDTYLKWIVSRSIQIDNIILRSDYALRAIPNHYFRKLRSLTVKYIEDDSINLYNNLNNLLQFNCTTIEILSLPNCQNLSILSPVTLTKLTSLRALELPCLRTERYDSFQFLVGIFQFLPMKLAHLDISGISLQLSNSAGTASYCTASNSNGSNNTASYCTASNSNCSSTASRSTDSNSNGSSSAGRNSNGSNSSTSNVNGNSSTGSSAGSNDSNITNSSSRTNSSTNTSSNSGSSVNTLSHHNIHESTNTGSGNIPNSPIDENIYTTIPMRHLATHHLCEIFEINISYFMNLQILDISHIDSVRDQNLVNIVHCVPLLRSLNISHCFMLTDHAVVSIANTAQYLEHLYMSNIGSITNLSLKALAKQRKHTSLLSLDIRYCINVTDVGIQELARTNHCLQSLKLSFCSHVSNAGMICIAECCSDLIELEVAFNYKINDSALLALSKGCPNIRALDVSSCTFLTTFSFDTISNYHINSWQRLKSLNLSTLPNVEDETILSMTRLLDFLQHLCLGGCQHLSDIAIIHIFLIAKHLCSLDISDIPLITDMCLEKLINIYFEYNKTNKNISVSRKSKCKLRTLELSYCPLITSNMVSLLSEFMPNLIINC